MDVSIVIINYNTFELTRRCIESIIAKTKECTYEIILVDNASGEVDPEVFLNFFPSVILVKSKINLGFAKGNNLGIGKAQGEYILLLNSDTELTGNDAVSYCMNYLGSHPHVGVAGVRLVYPDGNVQNNCQRFPSVRYKLFELLRLQKFLPKKVGGKILLGSFFDHETFVFPDWIWGTFFMFRKELLTRLKERKLADDYFMYVEDIQWCLDFHKLGLDIAFLPEVKVIHHMAASSGIKSTWMKENMDLFMTRNYSVLHRNCIRVLDKLLAQ